jgi:hypothetical protein
MSFMRNGWRILSGFFVLVLIGTAMMRIFGNQSMRRLLPVALLLMVFAFPGVCSADPAGNTTSSGEPVIITITFPEEGENIWLDVIPLRATIHGEVRTPSGLRSVSIKSETGKVSCGNATVFACAVPVREGENRITIIAIDNPGNRAEKSLNVTVYVGPPPPSPIVVSGTVTDREGNPVSGALVRFESVLTLNDEPLSVSDTTDEDGCYLVESAFGYKQTVTVGKDGYLPFESEIVFENKTNELDLAIESEVTEAPGFAAVAGVLALIVMMGISGRTGR